MARVPLVLLLVSPIAKDNAAHKILMQTETLSFSSQKEHSVHHNRDSRCTRSSTAKKAVVYVEI